MALTTEGIHAAADKLQANGTTPTQTKVREALGGGSFSTIGEALKTWKQE
ncbi:DNA-binding protein [Psychrobacter sp. Ps4]|nr:DNA-binding protein [Psychrobacter sp. Ps4]MCG3810126.1 DNA-binding protein [Psychrobacter sp. Ps4]